MNITKLVIQLNTKNLMNKFLKFGEIIGYFN